VTEPVAHVQQRPNGQRDAREPAAERDLADLDPPADLDFLLGR